MEIEELSRLILLALGVIVLGIIAVFLIFPADKSSI